MTNKEKANELSKRGFKDFDNPYTRLTITHIKDCCLEMAQWKDEQFKQILQVIYSKTLSIEKDVVIEQLYKKLFGEDLDRNELEKDELKNILEKFKNVEL